MDLVISVFLFALQSDGENFRLAYSLLGWNLKIHITVTLRLHYGNISQPSDFYRTPNMLFIKENTCGRTFGRSGMEQISLFSYNEEPKLATESPEKLTIVNAVFTGSNKTDYEQLFQGFDELYAITFSSGVDFTSRILDMFNYAEIVYGCEGIISDNVSAIMATQIKILKKIVKSKAAKNMSQKMNEDKLKLYVSKDIKSHEKIFILKASDGRTRVITGSANLSYSAFGGIQRENIIVFDNYEAFTWYKQRFDDFKEVCADYVSEKVIMRMSEDEDYIDENIEEVPIIQTINKKNILVIEEQNGNDESEIIADIKGLESEIKPILPKVSKEKGKIFLDGGFIKGFKRKYTERREIKIAKEKQLPKLHIDYERKELSFNGKKIDINPAKENITADVNCFRKYMDGLNEFHGDVEKSKKDYFAFMNWYFASLFIPYLRYVSVKNNYGVIPFPIIGIIYGDSNGGKSTFLKLLSKLMCGAKVPLNSSNDFTATNIEKLKCSCEGLPINIDDLAKLQYQTHFEKIIKDDEWGIQEHFINYPAVAITTNKIASLSADISKRAITCFIDTKIDKEAGAKNSKKTNESIGNATTAFYGEYVRIMLDEVETMVNNMKMGDDNYFPDIFEVSSKTLTKIIEETVGEIPSYVSVLTYSDYFGDKNIGRNAINKILNAWHNEPKQFEINRKKNTLIYSYPENGRTYELKYIRDELPPALNAQLLSKCIVMDLEEAEKFFEIEFRKRLFRRK